MFSSPSQRLSKYGLVGAFDSIAMMHDEDTAIIQSKATAERRTTFDNSDGVSMEVISESDLVGLQYDEDCDILTYFELQLSVEEVAAQLYHRFGVRSGDRVLLVCLANAGAEVVSCLACAKLGAPFVPIDQSWIQGSTRLKSIVDDALPVAAVVVGMNDADPTVLALAKVGIYRCVLVNPDGTLVTSEANSCDIRKDIPRLIEVDHDDDDDSEHSVLDSAVLDALPPLYILYTSGSTGTPKGVLGTHRGLMNRLIWQYNRFPFAIAGFNDSVDVGDDDDDCDAENNGRGEVVCRRTPLTFVDAIVEIFGPLLATIPIWVPPQDSIRNEGIAAIVPAAAAAGVSRITMLPSQLATTLRVVPNLGEMWPSLKTVIVSGEPCLATLARQFSTALPNCQLVNLYGSTEVAGDVTFAVLCLPLKIQSAYSSGSNDADAFAGAGAGPEGSDSHSSSGSPNNRMDSEQTGEEDDDGYGVGVDIEDGCREDEDSGSGVGSKSYSSSKPRVAAAEGIFLVSNTPCNIHSDATSTAVTSILPLGSVNDPLIPTQTSDRYLYAPIGIPIEGNDVYIVRLPPEGEEEKEEAAESTFELVPDGEAGELFVGGAHVAKGYHNRPEETRTRFIANPILRPHIQGTNSTSSTSDRFSVGPVYQTGDIVVRSPLDGALVWIGRKDLQVKIRGVRTELEEVERTIAEAIQLAEGVAVIATDLQSPSPSLGDRAAVPPVVAGGGVDLQLVLFVEESALSTLALPSSPIELRQLLTAKCPAAFVPALILLVNSLPRNTTGKLDRKQLLKVLDESFLIQNGDQTLQVYDDDGNNRAGGSLETPVGASTSDDIEIGVNPREIQNCILKTFKDTIPGLTGLTGLTRSLTNEAAITKEKMLELDFFSLGGDSLSSVEALWSLRQRFRIQLPADQLQLPVRKLARSILGRLEKRGSNGAITSSATTTTTTTTATTTTEEDQVEEEEEEEGEEGEEGEWKGDGDGEEEASSTEQRGQTGSKKRKDFHPGHESKTNDEDKSSAVTSSNSAANRALRRRLTASSIEFPEDSDHSTAIIVSRTLRMTPLAINVPASASTTTSFANAPRDGNEGISSNSSSCCMLLKPRWSFQLDRCVDSSPLVVYLPSARHSSGQRTGDVVAGRDADKGVKLVFIGSHGGDFVAVDAASGQCVWRCDVREHIEGSAACDREGRLVFVGSFKGSDVDGPRPQAAADDSDNKEDGSDDDELSSSQSPSALGTLWAIRVSEGSVQWKASVSGEIKSTPVYDGARNLVYVGAYDGYLYAFEDNTGKIIHRIHCGGSIYAIPILLQLSDSSDKLLVATTKGHLTCMDLCNNDAKASSSDRIVFSPLWTYEAASPIFATPTVDADAQCGRILVAVVDGTVRCLSLTGEELWRTSSSKPIFSSPAIVPASYGGSADAKAHDINRVIFGCHDGILRCVSLSNGEMIWETDLGSVLFSSAFIDHNTQSIIIASTAGEISAVAWETGIVTAKTRIGGEIYSSPIVGDGDIFIGGRDDRLHCIQIEQKG